LYMYISSKRYYPHYPQILSTVYPLQTSLQLLVTVQYTTTNITTIVILAIVQYTIINIITTTSNSAFNHYKLGPAQKIIKNNLFKSKRYDTLI
jgi:hypothetical protein